MKRHLNRLRHMQHKREVRARKMWLVVRGEDGLPKMLKPIDDKDTIDLRPELHGGRPPEIVTIPPGQTPEDFLVKMNQREEAERKLQIAKEMQQQGAEMAAKAKEEIQVTDRALGVLDDLIRVWKYDPTKEHDVRLTLQKNEHSSLHRLGEALRLAQVLNIVDVPDDAILNVMKGELNPDLKTFLVCHDWYKVLGDATGEFKLPFEHCAFEFKAENRIYIVLASQTEGEEPRGAGYYESGKGEWLRMNVEDSWWQQIRATCVMLDAEVATHTVHRIPAKMNKKRAEAGKVPMYDFHIVDLARRHKSRAEPAQRGAPTGRHVRLHFVRGHWRHYEGHKTWIKWHLRGDPDLGFIDKDYRL